MVSLQDQAEAAKILSWRVGITEFSAWVLAFVASARGMTLVNQVRYTSVFRPMLTRLQRVI